MIIKRIPPIKDDDEDEEVDEAMVTVVAICSMELCKWEN